MTTPERIAEWMSDDEVRRRLQSILRSFEESLTCNPRWLCDLVPSWSIHPSRFDQDSAFSQASDVFALRRALAALDQLAALQEEIATARRFQTLREKTTYRRRVEELEASLASLRAQMGRYENAQCVTCGQDLDAASVDAKEQP